MSLIIDKIKNLITPAPHTSEETIKELQTRTQNLEHQADLAETEAKLRGRLEKAKKRIKAVRKNDRRLLYILAGLVFLVIIIWIFAGSC